MAAAGAGGLGAPGLSRLLLQLRRAVPQIQSILATWRRGIEISSPGARCIAGIWFLLLLQALHVSAQLRSVIVYYSPYGTPCNPADAYLHFYELQVRWVSTAGGQQLRRLVLRNQANQHIDAAARWLRLIWAVEAWAARAAASSEPTWSTLAMSLHCTALHWTAAIKKACALPQVWVNGANVARGQSTYQTSTRGGTQYWEGAAVDGSMSTLIHTETPAVHSCESQRHGVPLPPGGAVCEVAVVA
jgi:hypothetical protein